MGLRPPREVEVLRDDRQCRSLLGDLAQYGSDDDDGAASYIHSCSCGHSAKEHGANDALLQPEEYARRARVAMSIDEHLEVCIPFASAAA